MLENSETILFSAVTGTFSLLESQCVSTPWIVFSTQVRSDKPL